MRILVVEDEESLRHAIARRLSTRGYGVDEAPDGTRAEQLLFVHHYDAIVLDRMLPDGDGLDHLRAWRRRGSATPALLLTAMDRTEDRVEGLEAGADDYLVKPFAMDELLARIAAIARRGETTRSSVIRCADVEIDTGRREVRRSGVLIPLRPKEYAIIELLGAREGIVVSRSEIIGCCWDSAHDPMSNVEEVVIAALRRKLGRPSPIRTVRGAGYIFEAPTAER